MKIGVDYYPEQWDKSMWQKDAELMSKTGVKIIRIAEFAWCRIEPRDSEFNFGWLDEVVSLFSQYGIKIIMCTPTNCPPLWLYEKYPEIVQTDKNGNRIQTGIRGHRCINSPVFLEYAKRIVNEMTRHYANESSIVAWQIDNELEANHCCCDVCKGEFVKWLRDKYDTMENVNKAFGNVVWSGEYSEWSQINLPTAYPTAWQNPAMLMDFYRYASESTVKFVELQREIIKRNIPKAVVTTNTWFCENMPDFYKEFENLDVVSYDNYPTIDIPEDKSQFYSHNFHLDLMRGVKQRNFWIMEQLSGGTGCWAPMKSTPKPNMIKGYALQAFAHGADMIVHFRWRTATTGAEMFWHGLIDHSNVPSRRFYEFAELCKTALKLDCMSNTVIDSDIAILYSPESEWAFKIQPQTDGMYYLEQLRLFHSAFSRYGANVDIISPKADISKYAVVIAPCLYINDKEATENIYRYVMNGGTVIMTNRSGVKDSNNNCITQPLPTVFSELAGVEVTEYDPIGYKEQTIKDYSGKEYKCRQWCDILKLTTARAYAEYNDSFYRCCPAITVNDYCKGKFYYFGTVLEQAFYLDFANKLMKYHNIPRLMNMPEGVEITTRTNGKDDFIIFFNNSEETNTISLPKAMYSVIDNIGKDKLILAPFDMDIVRR